jgi:hypothetical protein
VRVAAPEGRAGKIDKTKAKALGTESARVGGAGGARAAADLAIGAPQQPPASRLALALRRFSALPGRAWVEKPAVTLAAEECATSSAAAALIAHIRAGAAALPPIAAPAFDVWDAGLTYGELLPAALACALRRAVGLLAPPPRPGGAVFFDLGSGEGLPCLLAAALCPEFGAIRGVELVPRLHAAAERHRALAAAALPHDAAAAERARRVELRCGDFLEGLSLAGVDVLFLLGTCFEEDVLGPVWAAAAAMRGGCALICASHEAPASLFELLHAERAGATWGEVTLRFYRRL